MPSGPVGADRIRIEYERRRREVPAERYSLSDPAILFAAQHTARAFLDALRDHGLLPLRGRRVLEVGCGGGNRLLELETWGANRSDLAGIDLDEWRVDRARCVLSGSDGSTGSPAPGADIRHGDASTLPWDDGRFDIVLQSTALSSVTEEDMRRRIAAEMVRVLGRGGAVLWYDLAVNNPRNPQVHGLPREEIRRLFPGCSIWSRRLTLAPPLARRIVPRSWTAAALLERIPALNSHLLAVIRPAAR